MDSISLIIAGVGSIAVAVLYALVSKLFKGEKKEKITIRFEDGEIKTLGLTPDLDQDQRENLIRQAVEEKRALSRLEAFKLFLIKATLAIVITVLFILAAIAMRWLGERLDIPGFAVVFRIIELTTLVLGGFLCLIFLFRNAIPLVRFLRKRPPQATSD